MSIERMYVTEIHRLRAEESRLQAENERLRAALGPDLAGRDFAELLAQVVGILADRGDGPFVDCLRAKVGAVTLALASPEKEKG